MPPISKLSRKTGRRVEFVVILHNIRSVYNVGSIFRTADAVGVAKLYLTGITPSPLDRLGKIRSDFHKVALGAERSLPWEKIHLPRGLIRRLEREGWSVFALEQHRQSIPYYIVGSKVKLPVRVALLLGSEARGLPLSLLRTADRIVEIPMFGKKESLNVAVAFGVVVYHLRILEFVDSHYS